MEKATFKVRDYLKAHGAVGAKNAVPMKVIAAALLGRSNSGNGRMIRKMVNAERAAGAYICSSTGRPNGYYLAATDEEKAGQFYRMERAIAKRRLPMRPFQKFVGHLKRRQQEAAEGPGLFPGIGTDGRPSLQDGGPSPAEPPAPEGRARHPGAEPAMDLLRAARPDFYPLPESGDGAGKHEG